MLAWWSTRIEIFGELDCGLVAALAGLKQTPKESPNCSAEPQRPLPFRAGKLGVLGVGLAMPAGDKAVAFWDEIEAHGLYLLGERWAFSDKFTIPRRWTPCCPHVFVAAGPRSGKAPLFLYS
jgi:hypothetical protein